MSLWAAGGASSLLLGRGQESRGHLAAPSPGLPWRSNSSAGAVPAQGGGPPRRAGSVGGQPAAFRNKSCSPARSPGQQLKRGNERGRPLQPSGAGRQANDRLALPPECEQQPHTRGQAAGTAARASCAQPSPGVVMATLVHPGSHVMPSYVLIGLCQLPVPNYPVAIYGTHRSPQQVCQVPTTHQARSPQGR